MKDLQHDISRKKLNKLLGKRLKYKATIREVKPKQLCLIDVTYNGKLFADHVWVAARDSLSKLKKGLVVTFIGEATTYTDSFNTRKTGLDRCSSFEVFNEGVEEAREDAKQRYLRNSR